MNSKLYNIYLNNLNKNKNINKIFNNKCNIYQKTFTIKIFSIYINIYFFFFRLDSFINEQTNYKKIINTL